MSENNQTLDNQTLAEIAEFQKNLQSDVQKKMLETEALISNNTYDSILKSLDERVHDFLIQKQSSGESLFVSDEGKEFFQEVLHQNQITIPTEE